MAYPIMVDLRGRRVLVVGGGSVAYRKVRVLLDDSAEVVVVAPELTPELARLVEAAGLDWRARSFEPGDLEGCFLAVAATDDEAVNRAVFEAAEARRMLCNVVDQPELCSFIVPAVVRRGGLILAVSTTGASPLLARKIKERLADEYDEAWADYVDLLARVRRLVLARGRPAEKNRSVFEAVIAADLLTPLRRGDRTEMERRLVDSCGLTLAEVEEA